jgi:hypothetical protein
VLLGFNVKKSSFSSHTMFVDFIRISEHTATFSLHSINDLVLIIELESVYCAVRTGPLDL